MGALRAAELAPFGMLGVGLIYRWYRRWCLAPDDAVAVQSAPMELGFAPLTEALVDLQRTFSDLMRRAVITPAERKRLTAIARSLNFRDRSLATVLRTDGWPPERISALRKQLIGQKRIDALAALRRAPALIGEARTADTDRSWIATNTFVRDLEASGIDINLIGIY
jgi:hypothetical protein